MMRNMNRGQRVLLGGALALLALLLAGSIHPEQRQPERADAGVRRAAERMAADLPASQRAEWEQAAQTDPLVLFRCSTLPVH